MNGTKQANGHHATSNGTVRQSTLATASDLGGCHWIAWDSAFLKNSMPDPTRMFSLLCLSIMTGVHLYQKGDVMATLSGFYINPYVLFYLGTAIAVVVHANRQRKATSASSQKDQPLPLYDRWTAEWYWWNAWFFHAVMDASAGSLRVVPMVVYTYDILDLRFPTRHVVPWMIGMIELLCMYPLCLACCHAVLTKSPHRFALELITASIQIMGMIVFVITEVYDGQLNIPALDPVGTLNPENGTFELTFKLNLYHAVYYWFGFWCCNLIWGVVPYYRIRRAVDECHRAFQVQQEQQQQAVSGSTKME